MRGSRRIADISKRHAPGRGTVVANSMFQITGAGSGMDWGGMIDKIMENARAVEKPWETEKETLCGFLPHPIR